MVPHKFEPWEINPPVERGFQCANLTCAIIYVEGDAEGFIRWNRTAISGHLPERSDEESVYDNARSSDRFLGCWKVCLGNWNVSGNTGSQQLFQMLTKFRKAIYFGKCKIDTNGE